VAAFVRIIWIVLDSVGIGELPDAAEYGDVGRNTLGHIAEWRPLRIPNLVKLGLANIAPLRNLQPAAAPLGAYGKGATRSPGKDTTTGHWEMAGVWLNQAFPVYKKGFPADLIAEFERQIGRKTIGNKPASGTEIIKELGEEHVRTGKLIVYTSGDSVFQIAAHEDVIPIAELCRTCEIARKLLDGPHRVGRVIARPFTGTPGNFVRTPRRHDYAVDPPRPMGAAEAVAAGADSVDGDALEMAAGVALAAATGPGGVDGPTKPAVRATVARMRFSTPIATTRRARCAVVTVSRGLLDVVERVRSADRASGALRFTGHYAPVGNPSYVAFLDLKAAG